MRGALVIFGRELKAYFNTPIAFLMTPFFVCLISAAVFWLFKYFALNQADMRTFFTVMPVLLGLFAIVITFRLWSEEFRVGTAELLLTLPFRVHEVVLGKFLAAYFVLMLGLLFTIGFPLSIGWLGEPDWGPIWGGYFGCLLMGLFFVALGAFVSSISQNQVVVLLLGVLGLLVFLLFFSPFALQFVGVDKPELANALEAIGVWGHFDSFARGIVALDDIVYFIGGTVWFFFLNIFFVQARRY